ncbi:hypothetical protein BDR26DRAFT_921767 [Obelidium mucronatum]|nr:hypothetical protein BDR26DRAFT_921767 [Obelidium mucronatum]
MAECPICNTFFKDIVQLQDDHIPLCLSGGESTTPVEAASESCPICHLPFASLHPSVVWDDHVDSCIRIQEQKHSRKQQSKAPTPKQKQTTLSFVDVEIPNDNDSNPQTTAAATAAAAAAAAETTTTTTRKKYKLSESCFQVDLSSDEEFCAVKRHVRILRFDTDKVVDTIATAKQSSSKRSGTSAAASKKRKQDPNHTSVALGKELEDHLTERYHEFLGKGGRSNRIICQQGQERRSNSDETNHDDFENHHVPLMEEDDQENSDDGSTDLWRVAGAQNGYKFDTFMTLFLSKYIQDSSGSLSSNNSTDEGLNVDNKCFQRQVMSDCMKDVKLAKRALDRKIDELRMEYNEFVRQCVKFRDLTISKSKTRPQPIESTIESTTAYSAAISPQDFFFDATTSTSTNSSFTHENENPRPTTNSQPKATLPAATTAASSSTYRSNITTIVISDDSDMEDQTTATTTTATNPKWNSNSIKLLSSLVAAPTTPSPVKKSNRLYQASPHISSQFQNLGIQEDPITATASTRSKPTHAVSPDDDSIDWVVENTPSPKRRMAPPLEEEETNKKSAVQFLDTKKAGIQSPCDELWNEDIQGGGSGDISRQLEYEEGFYVGYDDGDGQEEEEEGDFGGVLDSDSPPPSAAVAHPVQFHCSVDSLAAAAEPPILSASGSNYRSSSAGAVTTAAAVNATASASNSSAKSGNKLNALDVLMRTAASMAAGETIGGTTGAAKPARQKATLKTSSNSKSAAAPTSISTAASSSSNTAKSKVPSKRKKKGEENEPTVKPDYSSMEISELEKIAGKYGIRKLPKTVLIDQLNKIWDTLHPSSITVTATTAVSAPAAAAEPTEISSHDKKQLKKKSSSSNSVINDVTEQQQQDQQEQPPTTKQKISRKKTPTSSAATPEVSLDQQIYDYIHSNQELYGQILRYKPLDFEKLHQEVKATGIKCSKKSLQTFLDARGITTRNSVA